MAKKKRKRRVKYVSPVETKGSMKLKAYLGLHSEESLALDTGVSVYAIRKYKSGARKPASYKVMKMMEALAGITVEDWFHS